MAFQPKTEPVSPPGFPSMIIDKNYKEMSISELVSVLRSAYEMDDFDRVEEELVSRDAILKAENGQLREKIEEERLYRIEAEEQLKRKEEQCERGKRAQESYEKLLKRLKTNGSVDKNTTGELRNTNLAVDASVEHNKMARTSNTTQSHTEMVRWTDDMDTLLLNALLSQQHLGGRPDGSWTTSAYNSVAQQINNAFGLHIGKENIKNRLKTLKKNFNIAYDMFNSLSGFAWNSDTRMFDADDEVWDELLKVKPEAGRFKRAIVKHYDILMELYAEDRVWKNSETVREKLRRYVEERNTQDINAMNSPSINDIDMQSVDEPYLSPNMPDVTQNMRGATPSIGTTTSRETKCKSQVMEEQYDTANAGIDALVDAIKDGNDISERTAGFDQEQVEIAKQGLTILQQSCPRHYSEAEVWAMLGELGISNQFRRSCYKVLIRHEDKKREVFGVPPEERLQTLSEIMLEPGFAPRP